MKKPDHLLFTISRYPGAVSKEKFPEIFAAAASERGLDMASLSKMASAIEDAWFPHGAVIDLQRLNTLLKGETGDLKMLASLSRIKLQGTDGIRGKVDNRSYSKREALELYLESGILSPAFFSLNGEAFAAYLIDKGGMQSGDKIVVGEDGRDALTNGDVVPALVQGLNSGGGRVLNAGIIPTPGVPYSSRSQGCRGGVIITASHNPSNQNGIKLLHDNFKLMDDGPIGEFGLTVYIYALAQENGPFGEDCRSEDISEKANDLLKHIILENIDFPEDLKEKAVLVYDGANGVFSKMAPEILESLPFKTVARNVDARGYNINQNGGVGELEGIHQFEGDVDELTFSHYFPVIREMFNLGRTPGNPAVFGIVNDGDGDRGYLLVYNKMKDVVHVVPGDELATLIIAKRHSEGFLPEGAILVNSVESDIMCAGYVRGKYHVKNVTACVGDKWLLVPAREGLPFVVGCEESGHVTFGVSVENPEGIRGTVFTGNGLLSALTGLEYVLKNDISVENIAHPFPSGHKDIRYVYFVDKDRFLPGTRAFDEAGKVGLKSLRGKLIPLGFRVEIVPYDDAPEMLYIAAFDSDDNKVGALFARNSGTESKTGVAIRCEKKLKDVFHIAMEEVHRSNGQYLKDLAKTEAIQEKALLEKLNSGPCTEKDLLTIDSSLDQKNLDALLYAMRKQKLIKQISQGNWIISHE